MRRGEGEGERPGEGEGDRGIGIEGSGRWQVEREKEREIGREGGQRDVERENDDRGGLVNLGAMWCIERNFGKRRDVEGEAWYMALATLAH